MCAFFWELFCDSTSRSSGDSVAVIDAEGEVGAGSWDAMIISNELIDR
jgi:hypothetical protein